MLIAGTWKLPLEKRSDTGTYFASKDLRFLQDEDLGDDIKFVGRWHNFANCTGIAVFDAKDSEALAKYNWKWTEEMADVEMFPVVTDDEAREIVLKRKPTYSSTTSSMENLNAPLEEGEMLFWVDWKAYPEKLVEVCNQFSMMTEEEDKAAMGKCRFLGRFHNVGDGRGFAICAAKTSFDIQQMCFPWIGSVNMKIIPVVTDATAQHVVQSKEGYQAKSDALKKKMEGMKV